MSGGRDHGGALDAAVARWGGRREDWLDLSTGIAPEPYPLPPIPPEAWTALPDAGMTARLARAARTFWHVPEAAAVLAVPGASAAIARLPHLRPASTVAIPGPTYNEHAAAFAAAGWQVVAHGPAAARVVVHPNNPDGRWWSPDETAAPLSVIDESFCDVAPDRSLIALADRPGTVVLKSFGKFWGLAGLRLGFAIGDPGLVAALAEALGPWPVSGPALAVGAAALEDRGWADAARARYAAGADRLDALTSLEVAGGTPLFRLYRVPNARTLHLRLAERHVLTRVFPYRDDWLRVGLPPEGAWDRLARDWPR
ncbi:pyridoxal phosphate-dependent class II aminotransferase [Rhodobacteraceae bacterium CCMM004]|nr:pyridoxal phosphate-dependent class II aminotransferase [Rhodobacteraceae bacterium CCMM004]